MNKAKLMQAMQDCNITKKQAREYLGISRTAFYRKSNGKSEFTLGEIQKLMDLLHLESADEIFFDSKVS